MLTALTAAWAAAVWAFAFAATSCYWALGRAAAAWHVVLWDPVWIVGGLLFVLAGRRSGEK